MDIDSCIEYCFEKIYLKKQSPGKKLTCIDKYRLSIPKHYRFYYPTNIILKVTSDCNLRCRHCFYSAMPEIYNSSGEFSTLELLDLAKFLADDLNVLSITITGGEPFLRDDIFSLIDLLKSRNIIISIQTNATLVDSIIAKKLAKYLNLKTDTIMVSVDGGDSYSNDLVRGKGSFQKAKRGILSLINEGIPVSINSTFTSQSANEKIFNIFNLGAKSIQFSKFKSCHNDHAFLLPSLDTLFYYTVLLEKEARKHSEVNCSFKILDFYDFIKTAKGKSLIDEYIKSINVDNDVCLSCHGHNRVTISSRGDLFLCSMDDSKNAILGNLRNQDFLTIWQNRFENPYFKERSLKTSKCKSCKYIMICKMGCIASAYKRYGDINMAPAECPYFEEYMRLQNG